MTENDLGPFLGNGGAIWISAIVNSIRDGITVIKKEKVIFTNQKVLEILGLSESNYKSRLWLDIIIEDPNGDIRRNTVKWLEEGGWPDTLDFWIANPDRERTCVQNQISIIKSDEGAEYLLIVTSDITPERRSEEALLASQERYRIISELVSDYAYSFSVDQDGNYVSEWLTEAFNRITGFSTPEEIDSFGGLLSLIHQEDLSLSERYQEYLLTGEPTVKEFRIIVKDGTTRWIRDYSLPVWNEEENRVIRLFGAGQDITTQKEIEEALRESERRNNVILDLIPDWIFGINNKWIINDFRGALETNLYGLGKTIIGREIDSILPPVATKIIREKINKVWETGEVIQFEFEWAFPDSIRQFEANLVKSGKQGILLFTHDISERTRLEKMKSDFINRASHELRTPLTGALLMSDLIEVGGDEAEIKEYWQHLRNELNRQRSLIEKLLTVGRLETGSLKLNPEPTNLYPILEEAIASVFPIAKSKNIIVKIEPLTKVLPVIGDRGALEQVFTNLLNNAIKFSPSDSQVEVVMEESENGIYVKISDYGYGIPQGDIPHLFEGFFRGKNATERGIPGSGVGLYIVKSIIEDLGGRVSVESQLNMGSTFAVWLPFYCDKAENNVQDE